jgi:uncharacterized protein (TIGR02246 family)
MLLQFKPRLLTGTLLVLTLFNGATPQAAGNADPFGKLRGEWATALHSKQLDQLVSLYAPDAVFLTESGGRFTGRPAIRELCQRAMNTFTSDIQLHSIAQEQSGNLGYDSGDYSETLVANAGGARTETKGTYMMVLKRQSDGRWLIQQQMWTEFSAPKH